MNLTYLRFAGGCLPPQLWIRMLLQQPCSVSQDPTVLWLETGFGQHLPLAFAGGDHSQYLDLGQRQPDQHSTHLRIPYSVYETFYISFCMSASDEIRSDCIFLLTRQRSDDGRQDGIGLIDAITSLAGNFA